MSTPELAAMARIVAMLAPLLKASGFLKRRHSFNRTTRDGLVHVVAFWMAPREPPAWTEVPGMRERVFGSFRLDLGVRVPEMTRTGSSTPTTWVDVFHCQLRRAGEWCDLREERAEEAARASLLEQALPWLDRFGTKEAVIEGFERDGAAGIGMAPAGDLDIAQLQQALGLEADSRLTLERYLARGIPASHAHYLADYLPGVGHGDLMPRTSDSP